MQCKNELGVDRVDKCGSVALNVKCACVRVNAVENVEGRRWEFIKWLKEEVEDGDY